MVLVPIPARIGGGVGEAEIGREVDHLGARHRGEQVIDHGLRGRVRQRTEGEIERLRLPVDRIDRQQLGQRIGRELREDLAHVLAGAALGGKQRDLDARMTEQEPQQFRTGVAGRAEYADFGSFLNRFGHGSFLLAVGCDDRTRMMRRMISGGCRGTSSGCLWPSR